MQWLRKMNALGQLEFRTANGAASVVKSVVREHGASIGDAVLISTWATATVMSVLAAFRLASERRTVGFIYGHFGVFEKTLRDLQAEFESRVLSPVELGEFGYFVRLALPYSAKMLEGNDEDSKLSQVVRRFVEAHGELIAPSDRYTMEPMFLYGFMIEVCGNTLSKSLEVAREVGSGRSS